MFLIVQFLLTLYQEIAGTILQSGISCLSGKHTGLSFPAQHVPGARSAPYLPSKWGQLSDQQHGFIMQSGDSCSDSGCRAFQSDIHAILRTVPHGAGYHLSIKGTEHFNFSDYAIDSAPLGLQALGALGSIDGQRGLQITRAYVRAFFDTYLDKTPSSLLQGPSNAYPEVQFLHV